MITIENFSFLESTLDYCTVFGGDVCELMKECDFLNPFVNGKISTFSNQRNIELCAMEKFNDVVRMLFDNGTFDTVDVKMLFIDSIKHNNQFLFDKTVERVSRDVLLEGYEKLCLMPYPNTFFFERLMNSFEVDVLLMDNTFTPLEIVVRYAGNDKCVKMLLHKGATITPQVLRSALKNKNVQLKN